MTRSLAALFMMAGACAADASPDDLQCGVEGVFHNMFDSFEPQSLTCAHHDQTWECRGTCCLPLLVQVMITPIACTGPCIDLDEAACIANAACFVTRDRNAFDAGTQSFRACYPLNNGFPETTACAMRNVYSCTYDGMCAGIYDQNATGPVFVGCVDKTATMP